MRIRIFFISLLFFVSINTFSNEKFFYNRSFVIDFFQSIEIKNGVYKHYIHEDFKEEFPDIYNKFKPIIGKYKLSNDNKFNFLEVNNKKYLIFYYLDTMILYDLKTMDQIIASDPAKRKKINAFTYINIVPFDNFEETSFLIEKNKNYKSSNLNNYDLLFPWVEGVKGSGINEKITFKTQLLPANNILIINGFINPKTLNLYYENNRVKKLKIKLLTKNKEIIWNLKDDPNLQMIKLPVEESKFEIIIIDVYKGTKYNDTCISGLFHNVML